jgi:hypothetical protein
MKTLTTAAALALVAAPLALAQQTGGGGETSGGQSDGGPPSQEAAAGSGGEAAGGGGTPASETAVRRDGTLRLFDPQVHAGLDRATSWLGESVEAPGQGAIGDVEDLIIGEGGDITGVVIGMGGFLGVAETRVLAPFGMVGARPGDAGGQTLWIDVRPEELERVQQAAEDAS